MRQSHGQYEQRAGKSVEAYIGNGDGIHVGLGTSKPQIDVQETSLERRTEYTNVLNAAEPPAIEVSIARPYASPFGSPPSIPFTLLTDGGVLIRIVDIKGEFITEAGECCLEAGEHSFYVTVRDQLEAVFLYQVITAEKKETKVIRWPTGAWQPWLSNSFRLYRRELRELFV